MNFFITGFIKSSACVSVFMVFILIFKHLFKNKISDYWNFKIWYILLFAMAVPLFPADIIFKSFNNIFSSVISAEAVYKGSQSNILTTGAANGALTKDFYISVDRLFTDDFYKALTAVYLAGAVVMAVMAVKNYIKIKGILKYSVEPDKRLKAVFFSSLNVFGLKERNITLAVSDKVSSPFVTGLIKPAVVFPYSYGSLSDDEINYIMLHETGHLKSRDIFNCFAVCFFQAVYWFNPIVLLGLRNMKSEMEIRCDSLVIEKIGSQKAKNYGLTILKSAQKNIFEPKIKIYAAFGANKELLKRRIESIANNSGKGRKSKFKSAAAFFIVLVIGIFQMPFVLNAYGFNNYTDAENEKIVLDDLSRFFMDYNGCFVLYSPDEDIYRIYNSDYAKRRISPNSTYKIYSAAMALEEGIISPDNSFIKWDGKENPFELWNMDQDLNSAMENSVNWYFNILNDKTGSENISKYLDMINYGNKDISGGESFYLESSLKISAIEQTKILSNLFNGVYDFDKENIDAVKNSMKISQNNKAVLYGKTGTGNVNGKCTNGSFTGCVENGDKEYYFTVNIYSKDNATGAEAAQKALEILDYMDIY